MLKTFEMPSSVSHFRVVWEITTEGTEPSNPSRIPSALKTRWCAIFVDAGEGTITLWGGISLPESPDGVKWDTIFSQTVGANSAIIKNLSDYFPYHFYRVQFTKASGYDGNIKIWALIEGNL